MEERITLNPKIMTGKPVIKGTRIPVEFILELLASGMNTATILKEYPQLKKEEILAALRYTTSVLKHEETFPTAQLA